MGLANRGRSQQPHVAVGEGQPRTSVSGICNSIDLGSAAWQILERAVDRSASPRGFRAFSGRWVASGLCLRQSKTCTPVLSSATNRSHPISPRNLGGDCTAADVWPHSGGPDHKLIRADHVNWQEPQTDIMTRAVGAAPPLKVSHAHPKEPLQLKTYHKVPITVGQTSGSARISRHIAPLYSL